MSVTRPAQLVFIGGTGRSGTHVLSYLLDRHSRFHSVPIECRFHCNPNGLADLVTGETTVDEFLTKLRGYWWHRVRVGDRAYVRARWRALGRGRVRGLHTILPRDRFEAAVRRFADAIAAAGIPTDVPAADLSGAPEPLVRASRRLFYDLLGPLAEAAGKPAVVEMSCFTIAAAPGLARIFPEASFVHTVRDGRDSGSSKVALRQKPHHPTDVISGIDFWADRLRQAEDGVRGLTDQERERLHALSLDELVWGDREPTYRALCEFLGVGDEPAMRSYFESEMTAANAHRERWREGLSESEQAAVIAHYERALARLEDEGYHCAPLLRRAYERTLSGAAR